MAPITPLLKPYEYFEETSDPLPGGTIIFSLHVIVELAVFYIIFQAILNQVDNLPAGLESEMTSMLVLVAVFFAIIFVIAWVLVAAIMHYGSGGNSTDGTLRDALGVTGWAYGPNIVLAPAALAYAWREVQHISLDASDMDTLVEQAEAMDGVVYEPISLLMLAVVVIWSVYILSKGTAATHDVPFERALLPAIIVGAGAIVLALL